LSIRVRLLFFGQARDAAGSSEEEFALSGRASTDRLIASAVAKHPKLGRMRGTLQVAVNEEIVKGDEPLKEGDVVALLPPVAGG
jgi:molybdopterin converting factor subunit 1